MEFNVCIEDSARVGETLVSYLMNSARKAGAAGISLARDGAPFEGVPLVILRGDMPLLAPETIRALADEAVKTGQAASLKDYDENAEEFLEVNSTAKLCRAIGMVQDRVNAGHIMNGVIIKDTRTAYISGDAVIGAGTVIEPNTTIEGSARIGEGCVIGPNTVITDSVIEDSASVFMSVVKKATVGAGSTVGPFAYIRPDSRIGRNVKVGDFVEVKNSNIGDGTKISHLTYVGDSDVGSGVNFGCGTVTVNYDGEKKHRTVIRDGAFIGCNTNLVAPVTVGENAYTAAGSTVTEDVPPLALAVARERQKNVPGWVSRRRPKK